MEECDFIHPIVNWAAVPIAHRDGISCTSYDPGDLLTVLPMASKRKAAPAALQPKLKAMRTGEEALGSGSSLVATWIENFNLSDTRSPRLWSPKTPGEKPHILTLPAGKSLSRVRRDI